MSRLQVGGLALCLSNGQVCKLISFFGDGFDMSGCLRKDNWLVEFSEIAFCESTGRATHTLYEEARYLLPLGDKQTQDQFKKDECEA